MKLRGKLGKRSALADIVIEVSIALLLVAYVLAISITALSSTSTTNWQPGVGPILLQAVPVLSGIAILLGIYYRAKNVKA
jgi:hypothetical protein